MLVAIVGENVTTVWALVYVGVTEDASVCWCSCSIYIGVKMKNHGHPIELLMEKGCFHLPTMVVTMRYMCSSCFLLCKIHQKSVDFRNMMHLGIHIFWLGWFLKILGELEYCSTVKNKQDLRGNMYNWNPRWWVWKKFILDKNTIFDKRTNYLVSSLIK